MPPFDRLERMMSRAIDRQFATPFTCTPMRASPNGRSETDPDRAPWEGEGILDEVPVNVGVEVGNRDRSGNGLRTLVDGQTFELSTDRNRCAAAASVRPGDVIEMGDRAWAVGGIRGDGMSRIVFRLHEA